MSTKENTSDEIDLGQLFKLIGNGVNKAGNFIEYFFKGIFRFFISCLQFLRIHFLKICIAGGIGVGVGWYLDSNTASVYISSMVVEPNFNSTQQLYNNLQFYNDLAKQKEYTALAEALKISETEATTIQKAAIESFSDQTQKVKQFSEFIQELDTVSQKLVDYEDYLMNFNDINAKFHRVQIIATDPEVAKKCQDAIVNSIENNEYFKLQKKVNNQNIALKDSMIERQLEEIDSLHVFYKKIKVIEANKLEGTTNINMAENGSEGISEIELMNHARQLKENKISLNNKRANTESTINIISDFPNKGTLVNDFFSRKIVLLPMISIVLLVLILLLVGLNRYLKNYEGK